MSDFLQAIRGVPAIGLLLLLLSPPWLTGCQDAPEIRLVPVFPADEPDLLSRAGVIMLELAPEPVVDVESDEPVPDTPMPTLVEQGGSFSLNLARGKWKVAVTGTDEMGRDVVYGSTPEFEVARGKGGEVKLFIGRSMAFNLVALDPPEVAEALAGLREHTATAFTDDEGHPWILVAGGRQPGTPDEPVALALLVDPVRFTVEQLPSLSCARSGHTGFAVQTDEGPRVVLAGGDEQSGACRRSLDVYDPISRTFQRIDPFSAEDRVAVAVPQIERSGTTFVDTGSVIVSGNPRVVIDLLTGTSESVQLSAGPGDPRVSAVSDSGKILVLTEDSLFVDEAVGNNPQCFDADGWDDTAVFGPVEVRRGGELYPLAKDRFLYAGGLSADGTEPEIGWSLVAISGCSVDVYGEGRREPGPLLTHGFALIDLLPVDGDELLLTGGWSAAGEPVSSVVLMTKPSYASVPTFHQVSASHREQPIALRRPRAGHATVQAPHDGSWWVLGGGEDARPEIFVRGAVDLVPTPTLSLSSQRRPALTSMAVVDTTPGTHALNSDLATTYPAEIYAEQADFSTLVFITAPADRGIKDGAFAPAVDKDGCDEAGDPDYKLVVSGNVPNQDQLEESLGEEVVQVIPYEGADQPPAASLETAVTNLADIAADDSGCAWRQLLKVGFDGLARAGTGGQFDPGVPVDLGVNVLVMVTSDDDCSQNIYGQGTPPEEVSSFRCTDPAAADAFDDYFGLPPDDGFTEQFDALVDALAWDKADLIVAVVGNAAVDGPDECEAGGYGTLKRPRRLLETLAHFELLGAQVEYADACGDGDKPAMVEALAAVGERIRARNPWQACVPGDVTAVQPEYADDDGSPRLLAVTPDSPPALEVKGDVRDHCWLVYLEYQDNPQYGIAGEVWRGVAVDAGAWWIATNFDDSVEGDCEWIVQLGELKYSNGKEVDNAELVCLP